MLSAIAIIPARGGSKGIPQKNLKLLKGHPLLSYAIRAALLSELIDRVYVSTDCSEIAKVAESYGASVISRPNDISGDLASSEEAILHGLSVITEQNGEIPQVTAFIQCTSPLLTTEDINGCIQKLISSSADSTFSACQSHSFLWKTDAAGRAVPVNHSSEHRKMRQELEKEYSENGAIYAFKTAGFLEAKNRFFGKCVIHEMPAERSPQIDTLHDFEIVSSLMGPAPCIQESKLRSIKAIATDFDGVLTDDSVDTSQDGTESVRCSRADGMGFQLLRDIGLDTAIFSTEQNSVVEARARKLKSEVRFGLKNKLKAVKEFYATLGISMSEVAFLGNDVNDLECLEKAGISIVPANAHSSVKAIADIILTSNGGDGAFREFADLVINSRIHEKTSQSNSRDRM